jgi:hypothetical protein
MGRPQRRVSRHQGGGARKAPTFLFGIFLLIGLGLLGGAAYLALDTRADIGRAETAAGTVIDLIGRRDSDGDTIYYPHVRYLTRSGETVEFTGAVGSSPPAFEIGEAVSVLYDPAAPEEARIDSFFQLWFGAVILGGIGLVFIVIGGTGSIVAARSRAKPERSGLQARSSDADGVVIERTVERTARD